MPTLDLEDLKRVHPRGWELVSRKPKRSWYCAACSRPKKGHPQCKGCGVMLGPKHTYPEAPDSMCPACRNRSKR